jgi:hypothetical protein
MSRFGQAARLAVAFAVVAMLASGGLVSTVRAAAPDRSDIVLDLDFSASILQDKANRDRFAGALEGIASRVDETSADLVQGDTTASIVQFAGKAIDTPGCVDLHLLNSPETVGTFADCLRGVAAAYRKGLDPKLTQKIGIDTNYVAAMEQAATHLPADAVRPAVILFTDGKHDVKGVPLSQVQVTRDRLFGSRTPFALLPVGMGLDPKERGPLETGLQNMRITRDMPPCVSGATFEWPQVVFDSAEQAGNAVAVALQDASCTFTVAATPPPQATPAPAAVVVPSVVATPGDGLVTVAWTPAPPPAKGAPAITDYDVRCRAGDATPIESTEGVSLQPTTVVTGLANGTAYICEVAVVSGTAVGPWKAADSIAIPVGPPPAPGKPAVSALDQAVKISVAPIAGLTKLHYECSGDNGATWPAVAEVPSFDDPATQIDGLTNGTDYVCRAFAANAIGTSEASPISDAVRPCGSALDCDPILAPIVGVLGVSLAIGLILALVALVRSRRRGYVLAVIDVVYTANLGYGSKVGMAFVRDPESKRVTDVVADKGKDAEVHIHRMSGGHFEVVDRHGRSVATDGVPIIVADRLGGRHEVVLRAFNTNSAGQVAARH